MAVPIDRHHRWRRRMASVLARMLAAAVILSGCGGRATIGRLPADAVILAFGDSLTSGKGVAEQDTYPSVLSRLTGHTVINAGNSGELSEAGLRRLQRELDAHRPDLVILCHGGNDMLQKHPHAQIAHNLELMITTIKRSGADVIIVGVPQPGIFLSTASFYEELAERHRVPYDGETVGNILSDAALKSDYVHPNAMGYRELAGSVATLINESQA